MKYSQVVMLVLVSGACLVMADEDKGDPVVQHIARAVRVEMAAVLATHREVQVDDMQRLLGIDPAQARQLKLAARGAADQYCRPALEAIQLTVARRLPPAPDVYTFEVNETLVTNPGQQPSEPFVRPNLNKRPEGIWLEIRRSDGRGSGSHLSNGPEGTMGPSDLSEQLLWTRTLQNILTDQQQRQYQQHREQHLKRSVVSALLAAMSWELALSAEQEPLLATWLDQHVQDVSQEWGVMYNVTNQLSRLPAEIPETLSDAQRRIWRRLLTDHEIGQW